MIVYNHEQLKSCDSYKYYENNDLVQIELRTLHVFKETYYQVRITPAKNHNTPFIMQYPMQESQFSYAVAHAIVASKAVVKDQSEHNPNDWLPDLLSQELILYPSGYTVELNDRVLSVSETKEQATEMLKTYMARVFEKKTVLTLDHFKTLDFALNELATKLNYTFTIGEPK